MRKQLNVSMDGNRITAVTKVPEGKSGYVKLLKKRIQAIQVTLTVTFDKVNENGTLSGATIVSAKGVKGVHAVAAEQGGGAIWVKLDTLDGVKVLGDMANATKPALKRKLFTS